ncbi:MAG TPA: lytic transglycosylase domain-containing protein [Bryobacteraceae bacterium]|nr:lytic transglycosylase domain-containing protein [Bryobacteraceae bacterium]
MNRGWLILFAAMCWGQIVTPQSTDKPDTPQAATLPPVVSTAKQASTVAAASNNAQSLVAASQAAMAAAIEKQRASVVKQVGAVTGKEPPPAAAFFTVPWVDVPPRYGALSGALFNEPPCDPLPADQLDPLIQESAQRESVRPDLLRAVIGQESGSRPCAVSPKGAQGLMQLMPSVIEQFGVRDPFDPKQNVEAGTKLLKQLLTKYNGDMRLALSAYNAGPERVDREGGVPQIPETINYVTDILSKLVKQ